MGISNLQIEALSTSPGFMSQVNEIVRRQALYKSEIWTPKMIAQTQQLLSNVVRQPGQYGFVNAIIADAAWAVTYNGWAADPNAAEGAILAGVDKVWVLLTGIVEPPDPVPPETP